LEFTSIASEPISRRAWLMASSIVSAKYDFNLMTVGSTRNNFTHEQFTAAISLRRVTAAFHLQP
jgi:hypothetical protein